MTLSRAEERCPALWLIASSSAPMPYLLPSPHHLPPVPDPDLMVGTASSMINTREVRGAQGAS